MPLLTRSNRYAGVGVEPTGKAVDFDDSCLSCLLLFLFQKKEGMPRERERRTSAEKAIRELQLDEQALGGCVPDDFLEMVPREVYKEARSFIAELKLMIKQFEDFDRTAPVMTTGHRAAVDTLKRNVVRHAQTMRQKVEHYLRGRPASAGEFGELLAKIARKLSRVHIE